MSVIYKPFTDDARVAIAQATAAAQEAGCNEVEVGHIVWACAESNSKELPELWRINPELTNKKLFAALEHAGLIHVNGKPLDQEKLKLSPLCKNAIREAFKLATKEGSSRVTLLHLLVSTLETILVHRNLAAVYLENAYLALGLPNPRYVFVCKVPLDTNDEDEIVHQIAEMLERLGQLHDRHDSVKAEQARALSRVVSLTFGSDLFQGAEAASARLDRGESKHYSSVDELFADLHKDREG